MDDELAPRELAALAKGMLLLDDARMYGLIEGGPRIDRDRAETILEQLAGEGIVPTNGEATESAVEFVRQFNEESGSRDV